MVSRALTQVAALPSADPLRAIVGDAHVRPAGPDDAIDGAPAKLIVEPGNAQELALVLRCADDAGLAVIPRGGGTKRGWGNLPSRADLIVSTARLNHVVEHAWSDMTATVEAGCTVAELRATLAQHGQHLA
ncbi:MAG: glycolate oxidase binding subunit, partial [Chloroflexota bacterium]|nr:glycolate oxidase binding subunit [Chloroflexota bacterium]